MRALVKKTAAPGFTLAEVPEPTIREDEVLIKVRRAGVCGTDVHIYEWDDGAKGRCKPPFVVGHEFAGDVVKVGALVTTVNVGDRGNLAASATGLKSGADSASAGNTDQRDRRDRRASLPTGALLLRNCPGSGVFPTTE